MNRNGPYDVQLSLAEVMTLRGGLHAYLREFAAHRAEDDGATHPEDAWQAFRKQVGQLLWRLEGVNKPPGASIEHSEDAVPPDGQ